VFLHLIDDDVLLSTPPTSQYLAFGATISLLIAVGKCTLFSSDDDVLLELQLHSVSIAKRTIGNDIQLLPFFVSIIRIGDKWPKQSTPNIVELISFR
jgi:hypothetical protein